MRHLHIIWMIINWWEGITNIFEFLVYYFIINRLKCLNIDYTSFDNQNSFFFLWFEKFLVSWALGAH